MGKRANGEGNVYQRANGTWEARIAYVDAATGQRKRRSFYGPTASVDDQPAIAQRLLQAVMAIDVLVNEAGDAVRDLAATLA